MYGSASWALTTRLQNALEVQYLCMLKMVFKCRRNTNRNHNSERKRLSNSEILRMSGMEPIQLIHDLRVLNFAGHVARMDEHRHPNKTLLGSLVSHNSPCTKSPYDQALEKLCVRSGIPAHSWKSLAQNRTKWIQAIEDYKEDSKPARKKKCKMSLK